MQRSLAKGKKAKSLGTVEMVDRASYPRFELDAKVELRPEARGQRTGRARPDRRGPEPDLLA